MTGPAEHVPVPTPPPAQAGEDAFPIDIGVRSVALTIIAVVAAAYVLHWAQQVFVPIVLGLLISYALEPVVHSLTRLRVHRAVASAIVVALLATSIVWSIYAFSGDAAAIVARVPEAAQKLRLVLEEEGTGTTTIQQVQEAADELQRTADEATARAPAPPGVQRVQVEEPTVDVQQYLRWGGAGLITFTAQATLVMFFVFFLLASGDLFKRKIVKIAGPSLQQKKITVHILDDINRQIARFLFVRAFTSVIVGIVSWIAFSLLGLEQPGLWGLVAGVLNIVPYLGPVIVTFCVSVVAFLQFDTIQMAMYVSGTALVITSLEGWLLTPWLTSRAARTNEVAIFVALIFWTFVWGVWGTLLAVPMLVAIKAFCDGIEDLQPAGELLGK
jgi:predicted PurR-regulated permease PerM